MMLTPLDQQYQVLLSGPNQPAMSDAVAGAGIVMECNNLAGFQAADKAGAQTIVGNEALWLPFAKKTKLSDLSDRFNAIREQGRTIGAKTYQLDDASVSAMQGYWNNNVWPIQWITMDDSTISLTQVQFQNGAQNILQYVRAMRANKLTLKNQINGAASAAALAAIDINGGWPSNP